jgi:hypothetical protein
MRAVIVLIMVMGTLKNCFYHFKIIEKKQF